MRNILFAAILFTTACASSTPETTADSTVTVTDSTTTVPDSVRYGKPDSTKF